MFRQLSQDYFDAEENLQTWCFLGKFCSYKRIYILLRFLSTFMVVYSQQSGAKLTLSPSMHLSLSPRSLKTSVSDRDWMRVWYPSSIIPSYCCIIFHPIYFYSCIFMTYMKKWKRYKKKKKKQALVICWIHKSTAVFGILPTRMMKMTQFY